MEGYIPHPNTRNVKYVLDEGNGVMTHYGRTSHGPGTIVKKKKKCPMVGLLLSLVIDMNRI